MLQPIMDVGSLMVQLEQLVSSINKAVMSLDEGLTVRQLFWILDNLVQHWMIFDLFLFSLVIIMALNQVFHRLSLILTLVIFITQALMLHKLLRSHPESLGS